MTRFVLPEFVEYEDVGRVGACVAVVTGVETTQHLLRRQKVSAWGKKSNSLG